MQRKLSLLLILCLMAGFAYGAAPAENFSMTVELVPGTTDTIVVVGSWDVSNEEKTVIQGYSVGVCHDAAVAKIGDCSGGKFGAHAAICDGSACANITCPSDVTDLQAYGYHSLNVYDNGITEAVIFDFMQSWGLESKTRFEIIQIKYDDVVGQSTVSICDVLGDPAVESIYVHDGDSISPATKGEVQIGEGGGGECPEAYALNLASDEDNVVKVLLTTAGPEGDADMAVSGLSFGVAHDSSDVAVEYDVPEDMQGAATTGAEFWGFRKVAGGVAGACVLDLMPDGEDWTTLPACTEDMEVLVIKYIQTLGAGQSVDTVVSLSDTLGSDPTVDIEVVQANAAIADVTVGDPVTVTVTESGAVATPFLRGDVNQDGRLSVADGIGIAKYVFGSGAMFDMIAACEDSADANDMDGVDTADAIYLLTYLFLGGDDIPAPMGTCGIDSTDDGLGCDAFACQ
jgi:hypothetical protein